jgi:predicted nucleic acid-binding protein
MPRPTLMVDAWAWIALYNPADQYHTIPRLSYTDCTTFAVMQQRDIATAFTGDEHFRILGFTIRP